MNDVTGNFEVLVNGNLETYNRIGDIPRRAPPTLPPG